MSLMRPYWLLLFLLYIPLIWWYVRKQSKVDPSIRTSSTMAFDHLPTDWKVYYRHFLFACRLAALGCLIIILCRPQTYDSWANNETEGTDIVIALDISTSMLAKDFSPNRLEAAKDVAINFATERESDNLGLVIFAGEAFTQVPMTGDIAAIVNAIRQVNIGVLEDGTAIGDGITTAINRIKSGKAKSKSIILLTDGSNNTGVVAPFTASQIAKKQGIKIYTIGVGTNGSALYPVQMDYSGNIQYQRMPVVIDEATLQKIATSTGGKYFRATSKSMLKDIFKEIDSLEKSRINVRNFSHTEDNYMPWAIALLLLLLIEFVSKYTIMRHIP